MDIVNLESGSSAEEAALSSPETEQARAAWEEAQLDRAYACLTARISASVLRRFASPAQPLQIGGDFLRPFVFQIPED